MNVRATTKLFALGTVALIAIVLFAVGVDASESAGIRQGEIIDTSVMSASGVYVSPQFQTDFPALLLGISWQGGDSLILSLRYENTDGWSEWFELVSYDLIEHDGWSIYTEPVITSSATAVQYKVQHADSIERVRLTYLGTSVSRPPAWSDMFSSLFTEASAGESFDIVTRAEWEADEDWRFNSSDEEMWETEYQWPEKFVLHHTAGSDGSDNPEGTIRGVYYWHAVVLGWGDIGYNYIIGQDGTIYEGRYGGDGVIGAHVYRSATCAKSRFGDASLEANFNKGTVGIVILGDYEKKKSLSSVVQDSLARLIAYKAKDFDIIPDGEGYLIDDTYPNIVGHRDLDCTDCPGKHLYQRLDDIRSAAQEQYEALGGVSKKVVKASLIDQIEQPLSINVGEQKEVWVEFINEGNTTWRSYASSSPSVLARSDYSLLYLAASSTNELPITLVTPNVAPGEVGRFKFTITAPEDSLTVTEEFLLVLNSKAVGSTNFTITANVTGFEYAAELDNQVIAPATFTSASQTVTVQFKNRGLETWTQGDVKLNIYDLGGAVSRFRHTSWPGEYGSFNFVEDSIAPNELATFTFTFVSPSDPGLYYNRYELVGVDDMVQEIDRSITRVDSTYQAELIEHNIPPAVMNTWRFPAEVTIRNVGLSMWDRNTILKVYDIGDAVSVFQDPRWSDSVTAARLTEWSVKPGETGTFEFLFNAPDAGLYFNRFVMENGGLSVQGGEFTLITRVDE